MAGRTAIGERVWDLERVIAWAVDLPEVDPRHVLMTGNSGGGMATTYAAACNERITIAVPSCSFATFVGENGIAHHCDCNTVPGIYRFGEFSDVAGLIAPRHLLIVNGREDTLFPEREVERAVDGVRRIYDAAGVSERFEHIWGPEGHRFYAELMWPWIADALTDGAGDRR
jgi:dienelactone hydrolase